MPYQVGTSAQRIRIGLTGLAFAFIVVLLGSVVTRSSRDAGPSLLNRRARREPDTPRESRG